MTLYANRDLAKYHVLESVMEKSVQYFVLGFV